MTADPRTISIILCSPLGLPPQEQLTVPLSTAEFNFVGKQLLHLGLKLTAFLDTDPKSLCQQLELEEHLSARILRLLARAGNLAFDQSSVASTGISILSRMQNEYPAALNTHLKNQRPPVLFMAGSADDFPSNTFAIAPFAQKHNELPFANALIDLHHHSPVAYAIDLDHAVTGILMAHQDMRLYVSTNKPLQGLIRQKTYRTAIQNRTLVLISLTHPLSSNTQLTHKNLWIGFSAHIIHAPGDQTYALQSLTPEQVTLLYTECTYVDHIPFDLTAGKPILLDDLRQNSFDTLVSGTHAEQTKNSTDQINVVEETDLLLSTQFVEESTQNKLKPAKQKEKNTGKPQFGVGSSLGIKRKSKKNSDNSQQEKF